MARINKTKYALLGVLSMGPASGYDIKKKMASSTNHFWREGDSSIYPILKQLLDECLVSCELTNTDSDKPKKVYTISEQGHLALQAWLLDEPELFQGRNELLLKVFFGWNVERSVIISHLRSFGRRLAKRLAEYEAMQAAFYAEEVRAVDKLHRALTLKAGILHTKASIEWSQQAIDLLERVDNEIKP